MAKSKSTMSALLLCAVSLIGTAWVLAQGTFFSGLAASGSPPAHSALVRANLRTISIAMQTYANSNSGYFPLGLSMLYPGSISDPAVFWSPGDVDPSPTTINNDLPDQPNSTQISYAYYEGLRDTAGSVAVVLQDNSLANNSGTGVHILTVDGRAEFFERCDQWLGSSEIARANLEQIGAALQAYAGDQGGAFPDHLSMLYPGYVSDPAVFRNPGDADPVPTTIDNDLRNRPNSAQISYEYFGAGYTSACSDQLILVQDNSLGNNGGSSVNVLTADGNAECFAPTPPSCTYYVSCRTIAAANLRSIGVALYLYAYDHSGDLPSSLSALYPGYVARPDDFWNPGDSDPRPITIDNDIPDQPNSARISHDYPAAGQNLFSLPMDAVLVEDSSPANNGGYSVNILFADSHVETQLVCGNSFADRDGDDDVDQVDFAAFQRCLSSIVWLMPADCECFDRPAYPGQRLGDGDVDQDDFEVFAACAMGPGIPPAANCGD